MNQSQGAIVLAGTRSYLESIRRYDVLRICKYQLHSLQERTRRRHLGLQAQLLASVIRLPAEISLVLR